MASTCVCGNAAGLDRFGIHLATCKTGGGRHHPRHEGLTFGFMALCDQAGVVSIKVREDVGNILTDGKKLDFICYPSGVAYGGDATLGNPLAGHRNAGSAAGFLAAVEERKINKYWRGCNQQSYRFTPVALDIFGNQGPRTAKLVEALCARIPAGSFNAPNWATTTPRAYWNQRLAVQVMKATADCIIRLNKLIWDRASGAPVVPGLAQR